MTPLPDGETPTNDTQQTQFDKINSNTQLNDDNINHTNLEDEDHNVETFDIDSNNDDNNDDDIHHSSSTPLLQEIATVANTPLEDYHEFHDDGHKYYRGRQAWNKPPGNQFKVIIALAGFIIMGLTDSALGAILPSLESHYELNDLEVSVLFLVPLFGSLLSAGLSGWTHVRVGRRGVGFLGASFELASYSIALTAPPFPLLLVAYVLSGLGAGFINGSWNAWIGAFENAHGVLGILHACYALGGMLGPAVVSLLLSVDRPWYFFYRLMAILAAAMVISVLFAFRHDNAEAYIIETDQSEDNEDIGPSHNDNNHSPSVPTAVDHMEVFRTPAVWVLALFLCSYNGIELGYSGWLITYMIRERHADPKKIGLISTGFWTGLSMGRLCLGFVTGRFKSLNAVILTYMGGAVLFHLLFWSDCSAPIFVAGSLIVLVGVFIGPIFPSAMVMATTVLPKRLHVSGISTAAALSGCGSAIFPVIIGAFITKFGASILLPVIFGFYGVATGLWILLTMVKRYDRAV